MSTVFLCAKRGVIGGRTDRTKDIKLSLIQLRVKKKNCKTENISIAKLLYKKVKR